MITIFAIKPFSGKPEDGIDNVNRAAFSRIPEGRMALYAPMPDVWKEVGALRRLPHEGLFARLVRMRTMRPDYLFGNGGIGDIPFILMRPRGTKYVIDWHTLLLKSGEGWRVRTPWFVRRFIFSRADFVLCVSEFIAQTVRRYFPEKRVVSVLNGIDLEFFNPAKAEGAERRGVIFVGTLQERKRPEFVLDLARAMPDVPFLIVGREYPPDYWGQKARTLPNVRWVPAMSRGEVAEAFAKSAAFIFPSLREPAAAVILEAMASGCVPIVSASGGNGEFLKDSESGFLIPYDAKERDAFAAHLRTLLEDDALREKMACSARAEAVQHSWEAAAAQYEKIFL